MHATFKDRNQQCERGGELLHHEGTLQHSPHMRLGKFFADQIADTVGLTQEAQQGTVIFEANHLDLIAQLIAIEPAGCAQDNGIAAAGLQLVCQTASSSVRFLKLEEMGAHRQHGRGRAKQWK